MATCLLHESDVQCVRLPSRWWYGLVASVVNFGYHFGSKNPFLPWNSCRSHTDVFNKDTFHDFNYVDSIIVALTPHSSARVSEFEISPINLKQPNPNQLFLWLSHGQRVTSLAPSISKQQHLQYCYHNHWPQRRHNHLRTFVPPQL